MPKGKKPSPDAELDAPASKSVRDLARQYELYLNKIAADQDVFGIILQVLLFNLIAGSPGDKEKTFGKLRGQVLDWIDDTEPDTKDPQGAERRKQITKMRAEAFLDDVGGALGIAAPGPSVAS
jgi:hypothetical protein